MEEGNLSDADTDELLGISGIEPFGSGASVYLTPCKSPPGSPTDLLASSPKRRPAVKTTSGRSPANISPSRGASGHASSPSRSTNSSKSPKRAVKKFVDSPGKLKIGDLAGNGDGIRRSSSQERLVHVRRYLANQEVVHESLKVDSQNKENLSNSVGVVISNPSTKINSAPASGAKSSQEISGIGAKSLPSSTYKVENVVVTSHHRPQVQPIGISWSDPDAPVGRTPAKPVNPIFTYKRKLFQEDNNVELNEKLKNKTVAEKSQKGRALKDTSNKKTPPKQSSTKEGVVHSGSPTQQTHCASKYKVSPRPEEGGATTKSPGKQTRASRSLDSSPEKRPSSIMRGGGSVSPGRRPGPVTFRQSPNSSNNSPKSVSPPKYVNSSPERVSNSQNHKHTEQSSVYSKTGRDSAQTQSQSRIQYSPEKYEKSLENTPATSGYYSGKSAFTQEEYSNPLDDFLEQYPLSPLRGDTDMTLPGSLPDSPGMKAAAETVSTAEDYDNMPREIYADVTSFDIEEMEGARDSLRTMLKLSTNNTETHLNLVGSGPHNESISTFQSYPEEGYHDEVIQQNDSFEEVATKALMGSRNEIDYDQALQLTSQLLGRDRDVPNSTLEMENQVLLDNLEREKFRRQHCEKQIGNLQSRLLETQEQLAVATSTEKKKDIMIEQLDKTLARVVEGWKKREADKKECIEVVKKEKEEFESRYHSQKNMLEKFEERLQKASKDLEVGQGRVAELEENKMAKHEEERQQWAEAIDKERSHREQAEDDHDRTREGLEHVQAQLDNLQDTLNQERSDWSETERHLRKKLADSEEAYKRDMDNEKRQVNDQTQLAQETQERLNTANIDLHKLRFDLENAMRERDSSKMEMSLLEARMESSKRQLEADLTSEFEKALSEKMNEAHNRLVSTETDLRESHRKQIQELNQRHSDDMEEQMHTMTDDFKKKEMYLKEQSNTYEERLEEAQDEVRELKANKHKMELQREREDYHDRYASGERKIEMANRMQSMMQTHCSEALTLLNSSQSPKKSYQHESVLSHIPSLANQTKPSSEADHHSDGYTDEGANISTKLPVDGAVVVSRPNRVHHDDGAISDVLSTEGDATIPTYTTSQQIGGVQSTYVPPIGLSLLPQQPIGDVTCLDSNRSSDFGSASQVTSHYSYSSVPYQPHMAVSSYQPSNTYSSIYEPTSQPYASSYGNGPIRSAFTMTQAPHQPIRNYTHPAANPYSNRPVISSYTSQPINTYHNHNQPMNTSYTNPPIGSQINQPMKNHYLPGQPYSNQLNYTMVSSQRPPVVMENVTKSDYSHLYNGNHSEPSAPSLSSGYSSMVNHSSRYGDPMRNGESQPDSGKDESTDMVSLLNGSTATHNDTCVSDISNRMDQHNQRQQELEHYVRMLLGKEPGIPATSEDMKNKLAHSPPQKLQPESKPSSHPQPGETKEDTRLVSTAHAPKYGSVMGLAREKLHVKKKGQEDQAAERKSAVKKSRDGPIGKSTTAKPWR